MGWCGESVVSAYIEWHALTPENYRQDRGVTGQAARGCWGDGGAVVELTRRALAQAANEGVVVDVDHDVSTGGTASFSVGANSAATHFDECGGLEVLGAAAGAFGGVYLVGDTADGGADGGEGFGVEVAAELTAAVFVGVKPEPVTALRPFMSCSTLIGAQRPAPLAEMAAEPLRRLRLSSRHKIGLIGNKSGPFLGAAVLDQGGQGGEVIGTDPS